MARLPALVSALHEVDGRERVTLEHIARVVREAGLIVTTKRGSGASPMSVRDAANLLIGANGCDAPKDAALAVQRFRTLAPRYPRRADPSRAGVFLALDAAKTFGDAVEALIVGAPELGALFLAWAKETYANETPDAQRILALGSLAAVGVSVRLRSPIAAEIVLWRSPGGNYQVEDQWEFRVDARLFEQGFYDTRRPDRRIEVSFGFETLLRIAGAVLDTSENQAPAGEQ